MSNLVIAWGVCLIITVGAFPQAMIRTLAYRSGEVDHTPTMRIAAIVAVVFFLAGTVGFAITSALLAARS